MASTCQFISSRFSGEFTVRWKGAVTHAPVLVAGDQCTGLREVNAALKLVPNTWWRDAEHIIACFALPKGASRLHGANAAAPPYS